MRVAVWEIARQEFIRALTHPIFPVACLIAFIIAWLYGAGDVGSLESMSKYMKQDALIAGYRQSWQSASMICAVMAIFMGATAIPYDRWSNSINVLLTKPLYRRDYFIGKFAGLSAFMLLFNTLTLLFFSVMMIAYFRGPQSGVEFVWRLTVYILVATLVCSLVIALNMLFGVLSRNILVVTSASIIYFFFDLIWYKEKLLGGLSKYTPMGLNFKLIGPVPADHPALFDTFVSFDRWFNGAFPLLVILFIEMSVLILIGMHRFSRDDNL